VGAEFAVVSLCRTDRLLAHVPVRREAFLVDRFGEAGTDSDENPAIADVLADVMASVDAFRAEGRPVLVHCFAGRSRTGFFLRACLRRKRGLSAAAATREAKRLWPATTTTNPGFEDALAALGRRRTPKLRVARERR
jgi:ADP-ribosyl-[dinitrogen reductase] hydrolase